MKLVAKLLVLVSMLVLVDGIAFAADDAQVGQTLSNPCAAASDTQQVNHQASVTVQTPVVAAPSSNAGK